MKSYDRITLLIVILAGMALVLLPSAIAQSPGPGGPRGGGGDRMGRGNRGGVDMGPAGPGSRGGNRGRSGRGGPRGREELTDSTIDLILKAYSTRDPDAAKKLEDQRKDMDRDVLVQTLRRDATPEYLQIMWEERRYTPILEWCERYVPDEAKGIEELKVANYDLYKKKLDALENKYRRVMYPRPNTPEKLIPVLVKDLQLEMRQGELIWQIRTAENQDKKDSLIASLKEIVTERYDLNLQQRTIQLEQIQQQIASLQRSLGVEKSQIEIAKDPEFMENAIQRRVDVLVNRDFGGGRRGPGRMRPPQLPVTDANDPNSNPAN